MLRAHGNNPVKTQQLLPCFTGFKVTYIWSKPGPESALWLLGHFTVDQDLSGCELQEAEEQRQEREQKKPRKRSCRLPGCPKDLGVPGGKDPAAIGGVHMPEVILEENILIGLMFCGENSNCEPLVLTRGQKR